MPQAFFEPDRDSFVATPLTRGPWDQDTQHAGPPAALLARAVEVELPPDFRLARLSVDILRPVPIGPVVARTTVRQGRRVARAQVALEAGGIEVMTGTAVAQRVTELDLASADDAPGPRASLPTGLTPLAPPEAGENVPFFSMPWDEGYHTAMTWSFVRGTFTDLGPSQVWLTQQVPLVAGEAPSPFQRTMLVADTGNGASAAVDLGRFSFVNSDLSVHLHRDPVGEWIGMDAATVVQATGSGLASTVLHDRTGPVGTGNQTLLIAPQAG